MAFKERNGGGIKSKRAGVEGNRRGKMRWVKSLLRTSGGGTVGGNTSLKEFTDTKECKSEIARKGGEGMFKNNCMNGFWRAIPHENLSL